MKMLVEFMLIIVIAFFILNITIWVGGEIDPESGMTTTLIEALRGSQSLKMERSTF